MKDAECSLRGWRWVGTALAGLILVTANGAEKMTSKDVYSPIDIRKVKIGGELGRRMDITVSNNLLAIDIDKDFLAPFAAKNARGNNAYIGLGKTLDAMVRLAATVPSLVYYRAGTGIAVNLYTPSRATVEGVGGTAVVLLQETDYPNSGKVTLCVEPQRSAKFPLLLRIPGWCAKAGVSVNGTPSAGVAKAGDFLKIDRTWRSGDKVTLDMAMPWRFVAGRKTQAGRAAVMRGPLVYTLNPARNPAVAIGDFKRLVLLPDTAELVQKDATIRPDGTACRIKADLDKVDKGALTLTLTEFPDPDGQATYFLLPDPKTAVNDELMRSEAK